MNFAMNFFRCLFSPKLYRYYNRISPNGEPYASNLGEQLGDIALGYLVPAGAVYAVWCRRLNYFIFFVAFVASSYALRSAGRAVNPAYLSFLTVLSKAQRAMNTETADALRRYDFDFSHWPLSFRSQKLSDLALASQNKSFSFSPLWITGWLVAHTFGIRLIYPGTIFGPLLRTPLEEARAKFVTEQRGLRTRIGTVDKNGLDTMFFDRRNIMEMGKTLVICFEGNAGFYEIGILSTPLELGYSVLGWNHPGFGGSSGMPYPIRELNAAEAVFDYAVNELGFKEEEIILFAWSIGGFPASNLAGNHPNIKGLILDATFDDIMPLALPRMPAILSPIVYYTIRYHVDLRIVEELKKFRGPVRFIRRTEDEIIADPPASLQHNRGNDLVKAFIDNRFPSLMWNPTSEKAMDEWLSKSHADSNEAIKSRNSLSVPRDTSSLKDAEKAQLVISIAERVMTDYKSTHCTPLPTQLFLLPTTITR